MRLGYLMNSYPMVSTTFIGREIAALEAGGEPVRRFAIRPWAGELVDPGDLAERERTTYLLTGSRRRLLAAVLAEPLRNPAGFLGALALTFALLRNARGGAVRHAAYLAEAMLLCRLARRQGIDHIHAHFSTNSAAVAMLSRSMGGPEYSFTVHGPDELFAPAGNSTGLKIARARFVAAISHFCRSQLMLFCDPAHWGKIRIVHCGVDPAAYGRDRRGPFGGRVLFVGRLDPVKGGPLLLEAFAAVQAAHPGASLTVVGDGAERAGLEARAAALGLAGRVRFLGYRPQAEVAGLLGEADVLVLPSFAEGVPVVLMEAMASRVPVIASRVAGVPELVEDGVSGFLVPPGDVATLAARLAQLLGDPDLCRRMGAAGRAKVVAEFDLAQEAAWLRRILAGAAPPGALRPGPPGGANGGGPPEAAEGGGPPEAAEGGGPPAEGRR